MEVTPSLLGFDYWRATSLLLTPFIYRLMSELVAMADVWPTPKVMLTLLMTVEPLRPFELARLWLPLFWRDSSSVFCVASTGG